MTSSGGVGAGEGRPGAMGVLGMRERAQLAGGDFRLGQGAAGGTRVEVNLPLPGQTAEARP